MQSFKTVYALFPGLSQTLISNFQSFLEGNETETENFIL